MTPNSQNNDYFPSALRETTHSFNKYFSNIYYVLGMILGAVVSGVNKTDKNSSPGAYILVKEIEIKLN